MDASHQAEAESGGAVNGKQATIRYEPPPIVMRRLVRRTKHTAKSIASTGPSL